MSGVLPATLEEPMVWLSSLVAVPRTASGLQGWQPLVCRAQVGKGNRQLRPIILGKGLALRVGYMGSLFDN